MSGRPVVSVVVPCFRQAHFLPDALESVFAQTYPAVEPIVVNDGSDDNTDEVARGFLPRIRYVVQKNGGLPAARNAGIEVATGQYLLFLDADDLLHPEAVAWLVEAAGGRDDVLAVCGWRLFTGDPHGPDRKDVLPYEKELFPRLIHSNIGPVHAFLCPRRMVEEVGRFEPTLRSCEDWDLWVRLGLAGAGHVSVARIGAYYRQSPSSMSANPSRMLTARTEVLLRTVAGFWNAPALLDRWGSELALATQRVRRRLRVQGVAPDLVAELSRIQRDLTRRGFRPPTGGKEAVLNRLVGAERGERVLLSYYRLFSRREYKRYADGFF